MSLSTKSLFDLKRIATERNIKFASDVSKIKLLALLGETDVIEPGDENSVPSLQSDVEHRRFPETNFPFHIIPKSFQDLATEYAKALQVRPEIMVMCMLTITSGAIGNTLSLQLKKGWETVCFLWLGLFADTGTGKSHAMDALLKPVKEMQGVEKKRFDVEMSEYNNEMAAYKADKKNNDPPPAPPQMRHFYTTNFTIESLIPIFQAWARGLIGFFDELAGLFKGLNQYKGDGNDKEQILSLFNAGAIKADRVGKCGYVSNSGMAWIGGMQHGILSQVFGSSDFVNGTIYRILPLVVESTTPRFTLDFISDEAVNKWDDFIKWVYGIELKTDPETEIIKATRLRLDSAALEAWKSFHDRYAEAEPFVSSKYRGYLPKLRTYCLKFMTILHVMEAYPHNEVIETYVSKTTVENAIALTDYFAGQALKLIKDVQDERNPYHPVLRKALQSLQGEVTDGKLLLTRIRERLNEMLPDDMRLDTRQNKRLSTWLKDMELTVAEGGQHKRHLIWEAAKIM